MRVSSWLWILIGLQALALEIYALVTDSRRTLSQTLRREFAHAPWITVVLFGAFVGWFTIHIWAPLFTHAAKATIRLIRRPK